MSEPALKLRSYQLPVFLYDGKLLIAEFARQRGKSFTLANWAVRRMLKKLAECKKPRTEDSSKKAYSWSIFVISNSLPNGIEFGAKVSEIMEAVRVADESLREATVTASDELDITLDPELGAYGELPPIEVTDFFRRMEIRIGNRVGRILILAASPRTARGFSGDLLLDEFAHHEDAEMIWDAAEPIISANPEFQVRISSTHNGNGSLFNRMIRDGYPTASVSLSEAWHMGRGSQLHIEAFRDRWMKIDPVNCGRWWRQTGGNPQPQDRIIITSLKRKNEDGTMMELTPEEREAEADNPKRYRQNYENEPTDGDDTPILSWDVIRKCSTATDFDVDRQEWSEATLERIRRTLGDILIGQDFARKGDYSVVSLLLVRDKLRHIGRLEMRGVTTPGQRRQMERLINALGHRAKRVGMDMTGNGLGLSEELVEKYGGLIMPVDFSTSTEIDELMILDGDKRARISIPERMATDLARAFEDGLIEIPDDSVLHDDLRKPYRVQKGNRVSIAAAKTAEGHADRFWSLALALHGHYTSGFGAWTAQDVAGALIGGQHDAGDIFDVGAIRWG